MLRENGLRMELHAVNRQIMMRECHQRPVIQMRDGAKGRVFIKLGHKRMIACGRKTIGYAIKKRVALVADR